MADDFVSRGDDLSLRFKSFTLTKEESKEVTILEEDIKLSEAECRLSVIGKVVSSKAVNLHGFKNTMAPLWGNPSGFKVVEIGDNLFQIVFGKEEDILRVLAGKPWFFNNSFLILTRWNPKVKLQDLVFQKSPIWIQIWGLPLQFYSSEVGTKIGSSLGEVLDIAMPVSGHREGRLMRILVNINITVPLRRGMKLKLDEGEPFWDIQNGSFVDDQYGSWLRVSPSKSSGWRKYGPGGNRWTPTSPEKSVNSKSGNIGGNRGGGAVRISNFEQILGREDFGGADFQEKIGDTGDMGDHGKLQKEISQTVIPANLVNKSAGLLKPRALGPTLVSKRRGRPPGSKSKSDIRRKLELKESGIAVLKELSSFTDKSSRVGDKRWSSERGDEASEVDGEEVCSPAKKPRGYPFTWRNNRQGSDFIESQLDRVLASSPWNLHYHQAVVEHLECVGSDHKALLLRTSSVIKKRVTPFRFDARWFEYEEVRQIIQTHWAQAVVGSRLYCLGQKIKKCRLALKSWRVSQKLNSRQTIDHAKGEISKLESDGREFHLEEIAELEDSLAKAWEKEEIYWMQKSRQRWLQRGDRNTSYFHASTVERRRRNHISGIENMQGEWISDQHGVMDEFQHFFTNLFVGEGNRQVQPVVELIPTRVTTSMNNSLIRPISSSEVKTALFDMPPNKAPGYDGMTAGFFQK
ncbi:hypothetical protein Vadar_015558 [Vaccinium darrowii]|uniref:Uncharacterized protein n=1 Tax=Vaccinium darrowii TaxID=229202 RepID=A0ACB7X152_9ERIC|nr:hypothetical protein Vadar_015558 [Vaccinium darrowii]